MTQANHVIELLFNKSIEVINSLKQRSKIQPTDTEKLKIYGLYKQAIDGDNKIDMPYSIQYKAKAKWQAWKDNSGKTKDKAKLEYIELVASFCKKHSIKVN
jgi:diazepam-binding inhibitor (GABA receptor modulating acyl-CoA-binding protein)